MRTIRVSIGPYQMENENRRLLHVHRRRLWRRIKLWFENLMWLWMLLAILTMVITSMWLCNQNLKMCGDIERMACLLAWDPVCILLAGVQ